MKKLLLPFLLLIPTTTLLAQQPIKGTFAIKNVETGMVLRIKDANTKDGTPIVAYGPVNWKCVTWEFKNVSGQTYQLKNLFSGKTIEASKGKAIEGDVLIEKPFAGSSTQEYDFIPSTNNSYLIKANGTDLFITPSDLTGKENSATILAKKNDAKSQQWVIIEQHPTM